jgi:DNA-binding NarL/FixJ family response regulator
VLVLTSSYERAQLEQAIETGAAAVLDKTTNLGQVAQAVRRLLAGESLVPSTDDLR